MQPRVIKLAIAMLITLGILVALEIATSALLPALGWKEYRLAFNVIIILFMALKVTSSLLPWFVLLLQLVHSAFSVEGWALGTLAGIIISLMASYLKEILQFSSSLATMAIVQLFQLVWHMATVAVICLKFGSFSKFGLLFWNAFPGTFMLSLLSPFLFALLDKVWDLDRESVGPGVEI